MTAYSPVQTVIVDSQGCSGQSIIPLSAMLKLWHKSSFDIHPVLV